MTTNHWWVVVGGDESACHSSVKRHNDIILSVWLGTEGCPEKLTRDLVRPSPIWHQADTNLCPYVTPSARTLFSHSLVTDKSLACSLRRVIQVPKSGQERTGEMCNNSQRFSGLLIVIVSIHWSSVADSLILSDIHSSSSGHHLCAWTISNQYVPHYLGYCMVIKRVDDYWLVQ